MKLFRTYTALAVAVLAAGCTDELYELASSAADGREIQFTMFTTEMADQQVALTRSGSDSLLACARQGDGFTVHPVAGGPQGLKVVRQVMPRLDVQPRTAHVVPDGSDTRAAVSAIIGTGTSGDVFHDSLTIWGYTNNGKELFRQILLKKVRNWRSSVVWPYTLDNTRPTQMTFYAIAPSMENLDLSVADPAAGDGFTTPPTFTYTLPETAVGMVDLLYGTSSPRNIDIQSGPTGTTDGDPKTENIGRDNKLVKLQFQHILTGVRFSRGTLPAGLTIKRIELQGVYTRGTFSPATTDGTTGTVGAWSSLGGSGSYSLWPDVASDRTENTFIDGDSLFFMIPQALPAGAKLNVTLSETVSSDVSKIHVLSCPLAGDVWKKGYTVNYKLTIGEVEKDYSITAEPPAPLEHSNALQTGSFTMQSYHNYQDYSAITTAGDDGVLSPHPAEWRVAGYSADSETFYERPNVTELGDKLKWLSELSAVTATGSTNYAGGAVSVSYTVDKQERALSTTHTNVLKENVSQGGIKDLGETETANCYIVNRIGSYSFPAYYGNKSSDVAEAACFVDHTGHVIARQSIKNQLEEVVNVDLQASPKAAAVNEFTVNEYLFNAAEGDYKSLKAEVLWQDVKGLISSPAVNSDGIISFSVLSSTPGNAVIALRARKMQMHYKKDESTWVKKTESGKIDGCPELIGDGNNWETLWTWHIWMTDEVYANVGNLGNSQGPLDQAYLNNTATSSTNSDHIVTLVSDDKINKIMPVNLGWVSDADEFGLYKQRQAWVKLEQAEPNTGTKQSCVVKIVQHARQDLITGTSTYYQWGRPTPFPGIYKMDASTKRTIYDGTGEDITNQFKLTATRSTTLEGTLSEAIAHPMQVQHMSTNVDTWFPLNDTGTGGVTKDYQLWKTTYGDKTVYDPCPPGFYMPSYTIFGVFDRDNTDNAGFALNGDELNIYPDSLTARSAESSKGGYFFVKEYDENNFGRYNQTVYMPCTGEYHGNKTTIADMSVASDFFDAPIGVYWTGDDIGVGSASVKAPALWLAPSWTHEGTEDSGGNEGKPAMKSKPINNISSVRAVRPAYNP